MKRMYYLIVIMILLVIDCNAGPRGMSAPTHDDSTAPDDAGPRIVALRALAIGAGIITIIIVIVIIIIKCCRSSRSSDL
jgi:hypothetical protein